MQPLVYYRFHKSLPPVLILILINPVHSPLQLYEDSY
jgi:hypothetical protein